jgi:hypothetical protein
MVRLAIGWMAVRRARLAERERNIVRLLACLVVPA